MINLSLTACSFHLKKTNSKGNLQVYNLNHPISIKSSDGNCLEMCNCSKLFFDFFNNYKELVSYDEKQQSFKCQFNEKNYVDTDNFIMYYVKIESGNYGSSSDIIDRKTRSLKYKKTASDIDVRPFYLMIVFPKDNKKINVQKGMFIFQNVGQYGIKTITTNLMQDFFSTKYGITLKCNTIAPSLFIKKVLKRENIKKISMIKNRKSFDIADNQSIGYGKEVREISNLNFSTSMWERIIEKIKYASRGKDNLFEFENKEYNNLKVTVELGGRSRIVNVHNLENLSIIESIPDDIKMPNGHPNKEMLIEYFKKIASEYLEEMVLRIR